MLPQYLYKGINYILFLPIIRFYLIKSAKRKVRYYMKGYDYIKKNYGVHYIHELLSEMSLIRFDNRDNKCHKFLSKHNINLELALRQYTASRILSDPEKSFSKVLLMSIYTKKAIVYPLPINYIKFLTGKRVKVSKFRSLFLWRLIILIFFLVGLKESMNFLLLNIYSLSFNKKSFPLSKPKVQVYFHGLSARHIPDHLNSESPYDFISYFANKYTTNNISTVFAHDTQPGVKQISSNITLKYQRYPFILLLSKKKLLQLTFFLVSNIVLSPVYFFSSEWWKLYLFKDLFLSKVCDLHHKDNLAGSYCFDNGFIHRPIWTYVAEQKGSTIVKYFVSTNSYIEEKSGYFPSPEVDYRNLNWPNYLFWDEYQEKYFRNICIKPFNTTISGPICYHHKTLDKKYLYDSRTVAVFDVSPVRESLFKPLALPNEYYTPDNCLSFLKDILLLCEKNNIKMLLKPKRRDFATSNILHPSYKNLLLKLKDHSHLVLIPPPTAPYHLIEATTFSIAMPFTSTAVISRTLNKPVCYYDPNYYINNPNNKSHGVDLISGYQALSTWYLESVNNVYKKQNI